MFAGPLKSGWLELRAGLVCQDLENTRAGLTEPNGHANLRLQLPRVLQNLVFNVNILTSTRLLPRLTFHLP